MRRIWTPALLLVCAGACGVGGGDRPPTYTPVSVTSDGSIYTLTLGDLEMVIDGAHGARITEFSLRGENALVTADQNANYGATFWPSPQASWCATGVDCWPPPDAIDSGPYTAADMIAPNTIALVSGAQSFATIPNSQIEVVKIFSPVPDSGAVDITYILANGSASSEITLAPWQVSRMAAGGLTFFGQGSGPVTYAANTAPTFTVDEAAGARWYASAPVTHDSKAFADGTGWIAQVTPERLLSLVSYPDIQPDRAAPGEAEIELFTNSSYVEVEEQGPFIVLFQGQTQEWTVRWKLRPIPGGTLVAPGSPDLVSLATAVLAE